MADPKSDAEIMYPNQQGNSGPGEWHIEFRRLPIFHRGHAFLALVDSEGKTVRELHGLGHSKHTGEAMAMAEDGADLKVVDYKRQADDDKKPISDLG